MNDQIRPLPLAGETWEHRSGRRYMVLLITNREAFDPIKFPVTVVYRDSEDNHWSRPAHKFVAKFTKVS